VKREQEEEIGNRSACATIVEGEKGGAEDVGEDDEDGEGEGKEEKSLMFTWDRFKKVGGKGGRDYRVDGEGDTIMGGV
jgi:hypothetical protein